MTMLLRQQSMPRVRWAAPLALAMMWLLALRTGWTQPAPSQPSQPDHSQHDPAQHGHAGHGDHLPAKSKAAPKAKVPAKKQAPKAHDKHGTHAPSQGQKGSGTGHAGHGAPKSGGRQAAGHHGSQDHGTQDHAMKAFLGPYGMNREGSGTSWLPDTTPHER